jgi:hypothetical protein
MALVSTRVSACIPSTELTPEYDYSSTPTYDINHWPTPAITPTPKMAMELPVYTPAYIGTPVSGSVSAVSGDNYQQLAAVAEWGLGSINPKPILLMEVNS